ncbi:MAG: hypothetical protein HQK89_04185 [Nitrospirae bacterium]|nr:hypothetical protein [Nitrospirota bacterium]
MSGTQEIRAKNGVKLSFSGKAQPNYLELTLSIRGKRNCILHWGFRIQDKPNWKIPPEDFWPEGSLPHKQSALRTPFLSSGTSTGSSMDGNGGAYGLVTIKVGKDMGYNALSFALFFPEENRWDNNNGKNYYVAFSDVIAESPTANAPAIAAVTVTPSISTGDSIKTADTIRTEDAIKTSDAIKNETAGKEVVFAATFDLDGGKEISVAVTKQDGKNAGNPENSGNAQNAEDNQYGVYLITNMGGEPRLHWGISGRTPDDWIMPPPEIIPSGSANIENKSVQTPFIYRDGMHRLYMPIRKGYAPEFVLFVLKDNATGKWFNYKGQNFSFAVAPLAQSAYTVEDPLLAGVIARIIEGEMGNHSWTLMHRFNLCHDLLDVVHGGNLALIYVWLRYSFLRQLDWQRKFNTQPRELSHAMERLTLKLSGTYGAYVNSPEQRELIALCLSTLGPGGDGQRVRDEILQIMHRHRIKETTGHFLEEWHQKLHNNTTADDVAICEAYLAFLRSNGNHAAFYDTLNSKGVTRQRLESFERPVRSAPDFVAHLKDALIHDFENYLRILRSVHTGTDLHRTIGTTYNFFGNDVQQALSFIRDHKDDQTTSPVTLAQTAAWVRKNLKSFLNSEKDPWRRRETIFLDLALEDFLRIIVERQADNRDVRQLTGLLGAVVESLADDSGPAGLWSALRHLNRVSPDNWDWHLHLVSVLDRLKAAVGPYVDHYYTMFHDYSQYLGKAFHSDKWVMELFTEEIIRTRPIFGLSVLLKRLESVLRDAKLLPVWQVVSSREVFGRVLHATSLQSVQHEVYGEPTVVVADSVTGSEEIPAGAACVITPDTVDLVSHVGVRARNARILFATCYDEGLLRRLRDMRGKWLSLHVDSSGDVAFEEAGERTQERAGGRSAFNQTIDQNTTPHSTERPIRHGETHGFGGGFGAYALTMAEFSTATSGLKSNNLAALRGKLPEWITLPRSISIPFGVMEWVLSDSANAGVARDYAGLINELNKINEINVEQRDPQKHNVAISGPPKALGDLKKCIMSLRVPDELMSELKRAFEAEGLSIPARWTQSDWDAAWERIKQVWASTWNEAAFVSRRNRGVGSMSMAVVIQEVVEADYAFVTHTVNPITGDTGELYGEVVPGLGETLVGNYPGRAFSFACRKDSIKNNTDTTDTTDTTDSTNTAQVRIIHYPSKSVALYGGGVIFRSDTSAEDLFDYAGAGLYDSVTLVKPGETIPEYSTEPLLWDSGFRDFLMRKLTEIGVEIENALGGPQDIEGAISKGRYVVLQSRPQVGIH